MTLLCSKLNVAELKVASIIAHIANCNMCKNILHVTNAPLTCNVELRDTLQGLATAFGNKFWKGVKWFLLPPWKLPNYLTLFLISKTGIWPGPWFNVDGLMQERSNSIANALELHLSCTNPPIQTYCFTSIGNNMVIRFPPLVRHHYIESVLRATWDEVRTTEIWQWACPLDNMVFQELFKPCAEVMEEKKIKVYQWPLLLTWFNFNPSMDK